MKKTFLLFMIVGFCACSNNADEKAADNNTPKASAAEVEKRRTDSITAANSTAEKEKGLELIAQSDCLTCHKVEEKLVGPAYREVAKKYNADEQTKTQLAQKVVKGGAGVWGQVSMPPHPNLTEQDAKTMVGYILSLKQ